jgi:hypothetical protein
MCVQIEMATLSATMDSDIAQLIDALNSRDWAKAKKAGMLVH